MRIMIHLSLQTVNKLLTPEGRRRTSPRPPPPPPQVGRGTSRLPTCSAHADGGATRVKKRFSLAARHRFFGQAPKKWGRMAGQAIDYHPTYRRTRTKQRQGGTSFARLRVRRSLGQKPLPPTARSTPFLCSCAKKRGGAPKKRAFGCRHGSCSVPPASPTNSKPQHHRQLRQADLSARSTHRVQTNLTHQFVPLGLTPKWERRAGPPR